MTYANTTTVTVEKTKMEIERTLTRYGASRFFTGWDHETAVVGFSMADRFVEFRLPLPTPDSYLTVGGRRRSKTQTAAAFEQAQRSRWRALLLCIKAKLESVESGIETFEEAFLSHIMISDGHGGSTTVGKIMVPEIAASYEGGTPQLALPRSTS